MRERWTTYLDLLGLHLVAAGAAAAAWPYISWAALAVAGLVILGGSQLAAYLASRAQRPPQPQPARRAKHPRWWVRLLAVVRRFKAGTA